MGAELGRTEHEQLFGEHLCQQNLHPPLHSHEMHELIQREITKEWIREEIIMSEIVRMRDKARREMMMESELALRRNRNGISYGSSSVMEFDSMTRLPLFGAGVERRSLEDRLVLSLGEREMLNGRIENDQFFPMFSASHYVTR